MPSLELLRRTSRLTGAFLEPEGSTVGHTIFVKLAVNIVKIRISASNDDDVRLAENLLVYLHFKACGLSVTHTQKLCFLSNARS